MCHNRRMNVEMTGRNEGCEGWTAAKRQSALCAKRLGARNGSSAFGHGRERTPCAPAFGHGRERTPCAPAFGHGRERTPCAPAFGHGRERTPCAPAPVCALRPVGLSRADQTQSKLIKANQSQSAFKVAEASRLLTPAGRRCHLSSLHSGSQAHRRQFNLI